MHRLEYMPQLRAGLDDSRPPDDAGLDRLVTEAGSQPGADYDLRATLELVELMNAEDATVPAAVATAAPAIAVVVDAISDCLARGGRLVYVGAGSSGRIAALDASECETTFSVPPGTVVSLLAGGVSAPPLQQEAAEDDRDAGGRDVAALAVGDDDIVVGISASGRTPYVLSAIEAARRAGARTACVVSAQGSELEELVHHPVVVVVGPEFLVGSTRLKAGTAQKLVLNTLSTVSMIRLGKTFGNLMVDVSATNEKLQARVRRIVKAATGASPEQVEHALSAADGDAKVAIVSLLAQIDSAGGPREARRGRTEHSTGTGNVKLGVEAALVDGQLVRGDVEVADGRVAGYGLASPNGRGIAVPGFVDLQVNGFAGVDLFEADTDGYRRAGEALLETGVTSYLPTFITASEHELVAALRELPGSSEGPRILGAHLEGPFLSPLRLGIHRAAARRDPDHELLERLLAAGPVRLMTLAPELAGAERLIETLLRREIVVSCGHSDATAEEANAAFDAGVRSVTHLFNAMRPFRHRDPGIAGAALARDDVVVQVILDGVHLAPETASVVWRAAAGRVALVTDAMAGAGLTDGSHRLGGLDIEIRDGVARGPSGALAGSTLTMLEAVRNLHTLGASFEETITAATEVPARILRLPTAGRLEIGLPADVVVLSDDLEIERVLMDGRERVFG